MTELFCSAKNGKVKSWRGWTEGNRLIVETGYVDGAKTRHERSCKGKNIGKINETTPAEQAILELNSLAKKKQDEGYKKNINDVSTTKKDTDGYIKPMLASSDLKKIQYPCFVQRKYDGIRCLAFPDSLRSRQGKEFTVPHILEQTSKLGVILDGELYCHTGDFENIVSAVKDPTKDQSNLRFVVYDIVHDGPYTERWNILKNLIENIPNIILAQTKVAHNLKDIKILHEIFVKDGYEGTIIRNFNGRYEASYRSADLIKYKDFITDEFIIVGGRSGNGKYDKCCIFECKIGEQTFDCLAPGTIEEKKQTLTNLKELIGKSLTVKFQSYTKYGIPRFPVGVSIRDYE